MYKKILLILTIISLFVSMYIFRHYLSIFYFQNDLNAITVNIESKNEQDIYACFNKNCEKMQYKNGIFSYKLNQENPMFYEDMIDNIELVSNSPIKFESISLFIKNNINYYSKNDVKINEVDFNSHPAYSINLADIDNNKTFIQKAGIYLESIFYNWYFYIPFYVLAFIYMVKYKPNIKINIYIILILAAFLRFSHIDFIPLWNDELYSLTYISNMGTGLNFKNTFLDPGNPPLFFIISNIWLYFFHNNIYLIRLLPLLIGLFGIYSIYFVANKIFDKKTAILCAFLSSINIFLIIEANEIRSYIFTMLLLIWGLYYFYKLKNDFTNKNLIIYSALSVCIINTHYYCVLYLLFNFILGMVLFKNKAKFLLSNLVIFLSFIPYFIISNKMALSENFNTWIEKPTIDVLYNHIVFYFGNIVFFIITIAFCIYAYKKLNGNKKTIFQYTSCCMAFVFIWAFLISIFIKPILFERYFCIFLPYLIINTSIIFTCNFKPIIIALIFLFSINMPKYENFNLFSNINLAMQYAIKDSQNYKNWNVFFVIPDNISYIKYFPEIKKEKVIVSNYGVREDVDLIQYYLSQINDNQKIILYLPEICINSKIKYSKELNVKRLYTTIVPIYKVVIE